MSVSTSSPLICKCLSLGFIRINTADLDFFESCQVTTQSIPTSPISAFPTAHHSELKHIRSAKLHLDFQQLLCPFWLSAHLLILVIVSSMTTVLQTKARTIHSGSYHRYEMNSENLALSQTWRIKPAHVVGQIWGIFLKMCGSVCFRSTFFGLSAGFSVCSIKFNFSAMVASQDC